MRRSKARNEETSLRSQEQVCSLSNDSRAAQAVAIMGGESDRQFHRVLTTLRQRAGCWGSIASKRCAGRGCPHYTSVLYVSASNAGLAKGIAW